MCSARTQQETKMTLLFTKPNFPKMSENFHGIHHCAAAHFLFNSHCLPHPPTHHIMASSSRDAFMPATPLLNHYRLMGKHCTEKLLFYPIMKPTGPNERLQHYAFPHCAWAP